MDALCTIPSSSGPFESMLCSDTMLASLINTPAQDTMAVTMGMHVKRSPDLSDCDLRCKNSAIPNATKDAAVAAANEA